MDLDVTLEQLYGGDIIEMERAKSVAKEAKGTRECNCRNEMKTVQVGAGQFQMQQHRVCEQCPNVKLVTEYNGELEWRFKCLLNSKSLVLLALDVDVEIGMKQGQEITYHGEGEPHIDGTSHSILVRPLLFD